MGEYQPPVDTVEIHQHRAPAPFFLTEVGTSQEENIFVNMHIFSRFSLPPKISNYTSQYFIQGGYVFSSTSREHGSTISPCSTSQSEREHPKAVGGVLSPAAVTTLDFSWLGRILPVTKLTDAVCHFFHLYY